jgi:arylsulfatase A-like enzyme
LLEVKYVDREIGRLIGVLESWGRLYDTVVVMTADHGEGLGGHDLVGHIEQLYKSLIHVPLIDVAPGFAHGGSTV